MDLASHQSLLQHCVIEIGALLVAVPLVLIALLIEVRWQLKVRRLQFLGEEYEASFPLEMIASLQRLPLMDFYSQKYFLWYQQFRIDFSSATASLQRSLVPLWSSKPLIEADRYVQHEMQLSCFVQLWRSQGSSHPQRVKGVTG
jgi:hypothetical protein